MMMSHVHINTIHVMLSSLLPVFQLHIRGFDTLPVRGVLIHNHFTMRAHVVTSIPGGFEYSRHPDYSPPFKDLPGRPSL